MHGGAAHKLGQSDPRNTPVAIVRRTFTETPLTQMNAERLSAHSRAKHSPTLNPPAFNNNLYCYNVPKPKRLIWLAIAVPTEMKPNIRSNGCVYLNTIEVNFW